MTKRYIFPCSQCGACCRQVNLANLTSFLDRGDGICCYLDEKSDLCKIYDERPNVCRVTWLYEVYFQDIMLWEVYQQENLSACEWLKNNL